MLESKIQKRILKFLKEKNCFAFKIISANINGIPDICFIAPNKMVIFIEVKQLKGKPSPLQLYQIQRIKDNGIQAEIVYSFEEFLILFNNNINSN